MKKRILKLLQIAHYLLIEAMCQIFFIFPIKQNKVIFDNFGGRGYGCDPKYIAEELIQSKKELDMVWLSQKLDADLPEEMRAVKYGSVKAAYELATAKVWIDNFRCAPRVPKKKMQYYIQTWHSALGLKKNERDASNLRPTYLLYAKRDARYADLMYSNNQFREKLYKTRFWYKGEVMRCGTPRNQILMHPTIETNKKVRECLGIYGNKKILLYAPTFRKGMGCENYQFDIKGVIKELEEKFKQEYVCIVRLHPNLANEGIVYADNQNNVIYDATNYPDIQELLSVADVLITDFSGTMFDFMITKKPVFLFAQDLRDYMLNDRELYFTMEELPFSMADSEQELKQNIVDFDSERYTRNCNRFMKSIDMKDDGNGAKEIANLILDKIYS